MSQKIIEATIEAILSAHEDEKGRNILISKVKNDSLEFRGIIPGVLKNRMMYLAVTTGEVQCIENYTESTQEVINGLVKKLDIETNIKP